GFPLGGHLFWTLAWITAGLTSFYMFRLWFMTFFGEPRWSESANHGDSHAVASKNKHGAQPPPAADHGHHVHQPPWAILAPLVVLAIGSIVSGWVGIPTFLRGHDAIDQFLKPAIQTPADIAETQTYQKNIELLSKLRREEFQEVLELASRVQQERNREEWAL